MTGRATFGDFAEAADRYLSVRAALGQPGGEARQVQEVSGSLLRVVTVLARYAGDVCDLAAVSRQGPGRRRLPLSAWDRAGIQAQGALGTAAAFVRQNDTGHPWPGAAPPLSLLARRLDAAAVSLTAGRDLLHTHLAIGPDGTWQARSEWAPALTCAPVRQALLAEVAGWARRIAPQVAGFALSRRPGRSGTGEDRRRLNAACQWLWALDTAVQTAERHDPVDADSRMLLRAVPVSFCPQRRLPDGTEPVTGLVEGTVSCAERVRHAAVILAGQAAWSPDLTTSSWRRIAATSVLTSHHCEILLRSLAARLAGTGPRAISSGLLQSADAAARARSEWLQVARAVGQVTTDKSARLSQAAAEAGDLALWTGRLAYADPAWTLARGPANTARRPVNLAPEPGDVPAVVAAVHHACQSLTRLASSDAEQIQTIASARLLLVPTSSLPDTFDIPHPFAPAPHSRTRSLLGAYQAARQASTEVTTAVAGIAIAVQAPSQVLAPLTAAADASPDDGHHNKRGISQRMTPAAQPGPAPPPWPRDLPGPIEGILNDLGVTSPDLLQRATAIDRAGERLVIQAAEALRTSSALTHAPPLSTPGGNDELISHMLATRDPRAAAALHSLAPRQPDPPQAEP